MSNLMSLLRYSAATYGDLWLAAVVLAMVSVGVFFVTHWAAGRLPRVVSLLLSGLAVLAIMGFALHGFDSPRIVQALPLQAVMIYGNLVAPLAGFLAAFVWRSTSTPRWRRAAYLALVAGVSGWFVLKEAIPAPQRMTRNRWRDGICLQTTRSSCTPAAAATLLACAGIDSSEQEMSGLCLTGSSGTRLFGLYRGLRIKTRGTPLRTVVRHTDVEGLCRDVRLPVILNLQLEPVVARRDPRYTMRWGWIVGVYHTVVLLGCGSNGMIEVGDPSGGRETWNVQVLRDLWNGHYVALEEAGGPALPAGSLRRPNDPE